MLELDEVTVRYGDNVALDAVSLAVGAGERLAVLGPSGSGKSTMLRAVSGLEVPSSGVIRWAGRDLAGVPVHRRDFGLMFQDYVLFPHRDVAGNVAFGPQMHGASAAAIAERVEEVLALVGLARYGTRRVTELSGGEQQRVALARALAPRPRLLMLDEPLGALDRALRERLLADLLELFGRLDLAVIYVTHDQEEALAVGDRVAVLRDGSLEAVAPPDELWRNPPNEFVAAFLGLHNVVDAAVDQPGRAVTPWGEVPVPNGTAAGRYRLLVRPDAVAVDPEGPLAGVVVGRVFRGSRTLLTVAPDNAPSIEVELPSASAAHVIGETVRLTIRPQGVLVLPSDHRVTLQR